MSKATDKSKHHNEEEEKRRLQQEKEAHERHAITLAAFQASHVDHLETEQMCVDLTADIISEACDRYIVSAYDKLGLLYTAESIWDEMTALISMTRVIPDDPERMRRLQLEQESPQSASPKDDNDLEQRCRTPPMLEVELSSGTFKIGVSSDAPPSSSSSKLTAEKSSASGANGSNAKPSRKGASSPMPKATVYSPTSGGGGGGQQQKAASFNVASTTASGDGQPHKQPPGSPTASVVRTTSNVIGGGGGTGGGRSRRKSNDSIRSGGGLSDPLSVAPDSPASARDRQLLSSPTATAGAAVASAPTWHPGEEPARIDPETSVRHAVSLRFKNTPKATASAGQLQGSRRASQAGLGALSTDASLASFGAGGRGGGPRRRQQQQSVTALTLTAANGASGSNLLSSDGALASGRSGGGSQRSSRAATPTAAPPPNQLDGSTTPSKLNTTARPGQQKLPAAQKGGGASNNVTPANQRAGNAKQPQSADPASPLVPASDPNNASATFTSESALSPEDVALLAAIESESKRRMRSVEVSQLVSEQLHDPKVTEKGFVVDALAGKVIPLASAEEVAASAKKLVEYPKFGVNENDGGASDAAAAATAHAPTAGGRGGGGAGAARPPNTAPAGKQNARRPERGRRDDNYFQPEGQTVAMVQNLQPTGGVGVKDEGPSRRQELRVPANKMSRSDYQSMVKTQTLAPTEDADAANGGGEGGNEGFGGAEGAEASSPNPKGGDQTTAAALFGANAKEKQQQQSAKKAAAESKAMASPQPLTARHNNNNKPATAPADGVHPLPLTARLAGLQKDGAGGTSPRPPAVVVGHGGGIRVPEGLRTRHHQRPQSPLASGGDGATTTAAASPAQRKMAAAQMAQERLASRQSHSRGGTIQRFAPLEDDL